jgi:hypothetical protein
MTFIAVTMASPGHEHIDRLFGLACHSAAILPRWFRQTLMLALLIALPAAALSYKELMARGNGGTAMLAAADFPVAFVVALVLARGLAAEVRTTRTDLTE